MKRTKAIRKNIVFGNSFRWFFFLEKKRKSQRAGCNITECLVELNSKKFSFNGNEQALLTE